MLCPRRSHVDERVTVRAQSRLSDLKDADAVLVGSGMQTREVVADPGADGPRSRWTPRANSSARTVFPGTLVLARLGLLGSIGVTDH